MQCLQYRNYESTPYRNDGRGGHIFSGVGSHVLHSDWNHRWLAFAFEVATIDQPEDSVLETTQLRISSDDHSVIPEQSVVDWEPGHRHQTIDPKYSSYKWKQHVFIEASHPTLMSVHIDFKFSDRASPITAEGQTHILIDLHPCQPPKYYNKPMWYLKKWFGRK